MNIEQTPFRSPMAGWSRNVGVFAVQVLVVAILLHRVASLGTTVTLNLFLAVLAAAVVAILLALAAFVAIWRDGRRGVWSAALGLGLGLAILAWPAALIPLYHKLPPIHDVTTDPARPPSLQGVGAERQADANPLVYPGGEVARMQLAAYPDLKPLDVQRSAEEAFEVMGETLRSLRWRVVVARLPGGTGKPGVYEAVDRTLILGFYDDIAVRIDGNDRSARIDVRSASRYGVHDFGRNAQRVRKLLKAFEANLAASVASTDEPGRGRRGRAPEAASKRAKSVQGQGAGR